VKQRLTGEVGAHHYSGIYALICTVTGKRYIGQASNIKKRWVDHLKLLRYGEHRNRYLQRAFTKYGEEGFALVVLERCDVAVLAEREQYWMDKYSWGRLFNLAPSSTSTLGMKYSEQARANLRAAIKRPARISDEERARRSERARVRWEAGLRLKFVGAFLGKKHSEETRRAFSLMRKGKPASEGSRKALMDYCLGKRSAETRKRMSDTWKRIWAKRKAEGFQFPKHTPEAIANMRAAQKKSWVARKAKRALAEAQCPPN